VTVWARALEWHSAGGPRGPHGGMACFSGRAALCSGPARLLIQPIFQFFNYFPNDFKLEITNLNLPVVQK
jgi:hypothetical protein